MYLNLLFSDAIMLYMMGIFAHVLTPLSGGIDVVRVQFPSDKNGLATSLGLAVREVYVTRAVV